MKTVHEKKSQKKGQLIKKKKSSFLQLWTILRKINDFSYIVPI